MSDRSTLEPGTAARLLWAAALVDGLAVFVLLLILGPVLTVLLESLIMGVIGLTGPLDPVVAQAMQISWWFFGYLILLQLYWIITELLMGGRTFGRLALMLELRQQNGSLPTLRQISGRAGRKILACGLTGLSFSTVDAHDRRHKLCWHSPLGASEQGSVRNWKIKVMTGAYAGSEHVVGRLPGYQSRKEIRIGRKLQWADIPLDQDERVSNQHAKLRVSGKGWEIMDYGGGKGSSNKIFVNKKAIPPGQWVAVKEGSMLHLGNVGLKLYR